MYAAITVISHLNRLAAAELTGDTEAELDGILRLEVRSQCRKDASERCRSGWSDGPSDGCHIGGRKRWVWIVDRGVRCCRGPCRKNGRERRRRKPSRQRS